MADGEKTPDQWGEVYRRHFSTYESLSKRLGGLVADVLDEHGIDVVQIEYRPKTVESFVGKITRKRAKYTAPIDEITDLIGVRVITYYVEDVARVGQLIEQELTVDRDNSVDKTRLLAPQEFGYFSVHYVVSMGETRRALPEWAAFHGKKAEIQVRTATQHAWAAIDHKLNYKSAHEVPDQLRRRFALLSALFELADDQFSQLRRAHDELESSYSKSVEEGDLQLAIDSASLDAYMDGSDRVREVAALIRDAGWQIVEGESDIADAYLDRRALGQTLSLVGIRSIEDFDAFLADGVALERALGAAKALLEGTMFAAIGTLEDILATLLFITHQALSETVAEVYGQEFAETIGFDR